MQRERKCAIMANKGSEYVSKIKIKTVLIKQSKTIEHHFPAIRKDNKLLYHDDVCQVTIDLQNHMIIRENEEFRLEMHFIEKKESKNPYILKQGNGKLYLDIHTYQWQHDKNKLRIDYQVIGSERIQFELEENYDT